LQKIAAGQTIDQILSDYPHLTREGVVVAQPRNSLKPAVTTQ